MDPESRQQIVDAEHVRSLGLAYYVSAAATGMFSLFGLFYAAMGFMFIGTASVIAKSGEGPPPEAGWLFVAMGSGIFLLLVAFSGLKVYAARCLRDRRRKMACYVVAALSCLEFPYGTALGIVTFVVLARPSVAAMFDVPSTDVARTS